MTDMLNNLKIASRPGPLPALPMARMGGTIGPDAGLRAESARTAG